MVHATPDPNIGSVGFRSHARCQISRTTWSKLTRPEVPPMAPGLFLPTAALLGCYLAISATLAHYINAVKLPQPFHGKQNGSVKNAETS
jgi:hypothetical protein